MFVVVLQALVFLLLTAIGGVLCEDLRITNLESFIEFSNNVNSGTNYSGITVFLDADFDFSGKTFKPIGNRNSDNDFKDFQGTFDGQGHVIKNLNMKSDLRFIGLFGYSGGATIKGIVLDGSCSFECTYNSAETTKSDPTVGGVIGWCRTMSSKCMIDDIVNMASVSFNGSTGSYLGIGGIAGAVSGEKYEIIVKNCANYGPLSNNGEVTNNANIGGIVGTCGREYYKYIQNCANYGTIDCANSRSGSLFIGGIVGYSKNTTISNCLSAGKITSTGNYTGGIVGYVYSATNMNYCYWTYEAWREDSYGPGSNAFLMQLDVTKYTYIDESLNDLNSKVTPENEWNVWFTLQLNGGKINNLNQRKLVVMSRHFPDPVKVEDAFLYWCTDAECSEKYESNSTSLTQSSVLYAIWNMSNYTVTFISDGEVIKNESLNYESTITYPENPSKTGHTFNGWDSDIKNVPDHGIVIHAKWTINNYTVTFMSDGEVIKNESLNYGSTITYPENPSKTGHTFNEWDKSINTVPAYDVVINARWTLNNYIVTFDFNNGTKRSATFPFNETIEYPENVERENYTFNDWEPKPERMPAEDITVKAQWNETIVTDESNTKTNSSEYVEIVFGKKDLNEEEAKEIIKRYVDEDDFTIEKFEVDKETGEIVMIVKFVDKDKAIYFVENVNKYKRPEDFISYAKTTFVLINFSSSIRPCFLFFFP